MGRPKKYRGILTRDLKNAYGQTLSKGEEVIVHRRREYDYMSDDLSLSWTGEWEYHYQNLEGTILIRSQEFYLE